MVLLRNSVTAVEDDLRSRCWSPGQCLRAKLLLHFQTSWLNCLKALLLPNCKESQGTEIKYMEKKTSHCEILATLPVWRTLVKFCGCWFVHFYPYRPVEKLEVNFFTRERWKIKSLTLAAKLYLSGGEMEATPVLPKDELDRLAWLSSGLSPRGGVLGTRSGLPDCTPEENKSVSN